jgi:hypothetical protein
LYFIISDPVHCIVLILMTSLNDQLKISVCLILHLAKPFRVGNDLCSRAITSVYWNASCSLSPRLILQPTVSRPVCLGIKHQSGAYDQIFITVRQLRVCWREDGSVAYNCCWPLPELSFSGPSLVGLVTIFYCLRLETSIFVISYDSQGYNGGIWPRLHTGEMEAALSVWSSFMEQKKVK